MIVERRKRLRILDFDIENRPLAYLGADFTTAEITAIAAGWAADGAQSIQAWLLGEVDPVEMLERFRALYDEADLVTGHYILMHDLPVINGAMLEYGLPPLAEKLVSDTKVHLVNRRHMSASQENLSAMLGVPAVKIHMSNAAWREANRLTPAGLTLTHTRVVGDVVQHLALRRALIERGYLGAPTVWRP